MNDPNQRHPIPTARDIMTRSLITLAPEDSVFSAIRVLVKKRISGAPVVDGEGKMVGMLSEANCLSVLSSGEFYSDDHREEGSVRDYMVVDFESMGPEADIYAVAQYFLTHAARRIPIMEEGELIGQVSRRDVLIAMEKFGESRVPRKHYPDYREPSQDVGARRYQ